MFAVRRAWRRRAHLDPAALVDAAKKEGKVLLYLGRPAVGREDRPSFEAKFPGLPCVSSTGAERVFQRIGQEYASRIYAVDVVNSSDAAHFIVWKREGLLAPFVPEDVARHFPEAHRTGRIVRELPRS